MHNYKFTIIDFKIPLSTADKTTTHKVSKGKELNTTINPQDLISIYRTLLSTAEYTFFSCTNKTFTKIVHILRVEKPKHI